MTLLQAGHCPHDEAPADVNAALMEFIGKATAA
jgi:pimeloyl-ACP methyl ester carboxylesterase